MRNKLKITKEQYNRIFASGLIKEHKGKLKITRDQYNRLIKESHMLGNELSTDTMEQERDALIRKFYRRTDEFSPFWEEHGLTYEDICEVLLNKGIIINKGAGYELSTKLGDPETAKQALLDELGKLIGTDRDAGPAGGEATFGKKPEPDVEVDEAVFSGEMNPNDPTSQPDVKVAQPIVNKKKDFELVADNGELAIFKGIDGKTYAYYYGDVDYNTMAQYADRAEYTDNQGDVEYGDDFKVDGETIERYVNDNKVNIGHGYQAFESGTYEMIEVDDELKQELIRMYDKNPNIVKALSGVNEEGGVNWANTHQDLNPEPKRRTNPENKNIIDVLRNLKKQSDERHPKPVTKHPLDPHPEDVEGAKPFKDPNQLELGLEEMTSAGDGGAFTTSMSGPITRKLQEMTDTTSTGNYGYDAPGIKGVSRKGEYKKTPKTKAEKHTQYPGGGFVEIDDCTKLNNNKTAINGGCSQGATDGVVKLKKSKSNVSAPSLGEDKKLYETIAEKTGRTVAEIKQIIESKLNKG